MLRGGFPDLRFTVDHLEPDADRVFDQLAMLAQLGAMGLATRFLSRAFDRSTRPEFSSGARVARAAVRGMGSRQADSPCAASGRRHVGSEWPCPARYLSVWAPGTRTANA